MGLVGRCAGTLDAGCLGVFSCVHWRSFVVWSWACQGERYGGGVC